MAILRAKDIRKMSDGDRAKQLKDLRSELLRQRAITATGGAPENPGKIGELRRTIARLTTIEAELQKEEKR